MLDMCRSRRWVRRQQRKSSGVDVVANARKQRETTRLARTRETERQQQQRAELMGGAIPHKPAPRSALDPRSSRITSKGVKTAQGTYTAQEYVDRLHQDNTRSLDNTLRVMYDSDRLASENLSTLQKQTEQMKRIDNDLQEVIILYIYIYIQFLLNLFIPFLSHFRNMNYAFLIIFYLLRWMQH